MGYFVYIYDVQFQLNPFQFQVVTLYNVERFVGGILTQAIVKH